MAKTLIVYYSLTGNTKTVAEAIHEASEGEKTLKSTAEVTDEDISQAGLIFIGFPVHSHSVPYKVEMLLKRIPTDKKIALFSTHGAITGSHLSRQALEYASALISKAKILGSFACRGKMSEKARETHSRLPEHKVWTEMAVSSRNHPTESDLEDARAFARWIQMLAVQP
jgi:flavodoxin I